MNECMNDCSGVDGLIAENTPPYFLSSLKCILPQAAKRQRKALRRSHAKRQNRSSSSSSSSQPSAIEPLELPRHISEPFSFPRPAATTALTNNDDDHHPSTTRLPSSSSSSSSSMELAQLLARFVTFTSIRLFFSGAM